MRTTLLRWSFVAACGLGSVLLSQEMMQGWRAYYTLRYTAMARNLAAGHGMVPVAGGEPVEAVASPLWLALLAVAETTGLPAWTMVSAMSPVLVVATVVTGWLAARAALGDHARGRRSALVVPLLVALAAPLTIHGANGLETGLFTWLVALALWRLVAEARPGATPWSGLVFGLLTVARPEGPLYLLAGAAAMLRMHGRRPTTLARWLALALPLPLLATAARWSLFGSVVPLSFHGRMPTPELPLPGHWQQIPWVYPRRAADALGWSWALPLAIVGAVGHAPTGRRGGWRGAVAGALIVATAGAVWLDHPTVSSVVFLGALAWLPLVAAGSARAPARLASTALALTGLLFMLVAGADWMKGYRLAAPMVVPLALLWALGLDSLAHGARAVGPWARWGAGAAALALVGWVGHRNVGMLQDVARRPDASAGNMMRRVHYANDIRQALFLDDGPMVVFVITPGPYIAAGGFDVVDRTGDMSVPFALSPFEDRTRFAGHILSQQPRPHLLHNHGGWRVRLPADVQRRYEEVPGWPIAGGHTHRGTFVRRDLVFRDHPLEDQPVDDGDHLGGLRLPVPAAPGGAAYLELAVRSLAATDLQVWVSVDGSGGAASWKLHPAHGWWPSQTWGPGEWAHTQHALPLPESLAPGTYDVSVTFTEAGDVVPQPEGLSTVVHDALEVVDRATLATQADEAVARAMEAASAGRCDDASEHWRLARRRYPEQPSWAEERAGPVNTARAGCRLRQAAEAEPREAARHIARARWLDLGHPELDAVAQPVADALQQQGAEAFQRADWAEAFDAWTDALRADPTRARLRRRTEEARHRLLRRQAADGSDP